MSKALQQMWVRRCEIGLVAVVLLTTALVLTFVVSAPDTHGAGHLSLALPAAFFVLLAVPFRIWEWELYEKLVWPEEPFLPSSCGRAPPA